MALNAGTIYTQLKVGTKEFTRGLDKADRHVKTFTGRLKTNFHSITTSVFSLRNAVIALAGTYGLSRLTSSAISTANSFEQMEMKLDALTKGRGRETLEEINQWALEMPVNTKKAVDAFAMMMAYGLKPTTEAMTTLVDVSVMFGEEAMPRIARALGQMQARSKLSAQEIMQLSEVGINASKYIQQAFGMTVEEVQKSGMAIEKVIEAIVTGLERDFGGASKRAMNTWKGLTDIFKSYITEITRTVMSGGAFDILKTVLRSINEQLAKFTGWIKTIGATKLNEWIFNVSIAMVQGMKSISMAIENAIPSVKSLWEKYKWLDEKARSVSSWFIKMQDYLMDLNQTIKESVGLAEEMEGSEFFQGGGPGKPSGAGGAFGPEQKTIMEGFFDSLLNNLERARNDLGKSEKAMKSFGEQGKKSVSDLVDITEHYAGELHSLMHPEEVAMGFPEKIEESMDKVELSITEHIDSIDTKYEDFLNDVKLRTEDIFAIIFDNNPINCYII